MTDSRRGWFDVAAHGARGDGHATDTRAIQSALDACARAGGGTVYFPPGRYRSGSLTLRSRLELRLERGAVLEGSPHEADYIAGPPLGRSSSGLGTGCLLTGMNLDGIAIVGGGEIHGRGLDFWTREMHNRVVWRPKPFRPRSLITLVNCRDISLEGITLRDSPCYTVWLLGCERAALRNLTILNNRKGPNTDALDIDGCRGVRVSDCHIEAGDDCIALKSDSGRLGRQMACERIAISNCTLSSTACAVRIGYEGDAPIRHCTFNNLVIWNSHVGLDLISILPEPRPGFEIKAGARIEQIAFSNILMDRVERPIYLWMGNPAGGRFRGAIRGVSFSDVTASGAASSCLVGAEERWAEDIARRHVRLNLLRGRMPAVPDELDVWARTPTPYGLDCRRVRGLRLADVRIAAPPGGGWRSPLHCRQIEGLDLVELRAPGPELQAVKRLIVTGGQTDPGLARR